MSIEIHSSSRILRQALKIERGTQGRKYGAIINLGIGHALINNNIF